MQFSKNCNFFLILVQKSRAFSTPLFHHTPVNDQSTNHCLEEVLCGLFQKLLTGSGSSSVIRGRYPTLENIANL